MFKDKISALIREKIGQEYASLVEVFPPQNPEFGDFSTNIAMKLARPLRKIPVMIAEELKEKLALPEIEKMEVVKPGYLNFYLKAEVFSKNLQEILSQKEKYGMGEREEKKRILLEFAHPNPFKIMHIGHLRNISLGESLVRLLEFQGAEVIRANYQGDVGMHVAKCVWALKKVPRKKFPKTINERVALLGKSYVEGSKAFEESETAKKEITAVNKAIYQKTDPEITELWQLGVKWSLDKFHELYKRVDSHFAREYMESETLPYVDQEIKLAKKKRNSHRKPGCFDF